MQIHTLQPARGSKPKKKRVGRGNASGKGNYSTRGLKGQRARSGGKGGLKLKGMRRTIRRIPKKRGFTSFARPAATVTLDTLERLFADGDTVNLSQLRAKGIIATMDKRAKIVARGSLAKKLVIEGCAASEGAKKAIEAKGGQVK